MGIAGSGKGTQGKLLGTMKGYHVISTGELLRSYGSEDQHKRMLAGEILGDDEVTELLNKALGNLDDQDKTILDGYPRTISQSDWLLEQASKGRFRIDHVIHLIASKEAVKERLAARGRTDDHDEAIEARFKEYEQSTLPIINHLLKNDVDVIEVNAEQAIENVHNEINSAISNLRSGTKA